MKKNVVVWAILITLVFFNSCGKDSDVPQIEFSSPSEPYQCFLIGDLIPFSLDVEGKDGLDFKVTYSINDSVIGSVFSYPYVFIWDSYGYTSGEYTVSAQILNSDDISNTIQTIFNLSAPDQKPKACFYATPDTGSVPLTVTFYDSSSFSPEHWEWDFGDGEVSTEKTPQHIYTNEGEFIARLKVSNEYGSHSAWHYIRVFNEGYGYTGEPCPGQPLVVDIDGNIYNTVQIGYQCWMKENLKVSHYPNGDFIPEINDNDEWAQLLDNTTDDAYCIGEANVGGLYTFAAAIGDNWQKDNTDGQGICPDGWHIPIADDWEELEMALYLISRENDTHGIGGTMKEKGTENWFYPNTYATNVSGFTALPSGRRDNLNGTYENQGRNCYWWCPKNENNESHFIYLSYSSYDLYKSFLLGGQPINQSYGFSIRCVRN